MGTLYLDRKEAHLKLDGNALALYSQEGKEGIIPINPLDRVVIVGSITIDTPVLHKLANDNISVIFLSGKRLNFSGMLHGRLHNNALLRLRQYEKSTGDFALNFAKSIVTRKIQSQLDCLTRAREQRHDLRFELTNALNTLSAVLTTLGPEMPSLDTLRGYEGGAAASYFSAYTSLFPASLEFTKRKRRPPEDPVNAVLSLGYTLLHFDFVREIEVIGLDPCIGFYHQFAYGRESLACDLVETMRSAFDEFTWELFRSRDFTSRDFSSGNERPGCYLKKEGRKRFFPMYEEWMKGIRPKIVEEVRQLARGLSHER